MPAVTVFSSARPWSCTSSQKPPGGGAEHPGEVLGARLRRLVIPLPQVQRNLARQAGGEPDQAVRVLLQHLTVDARPPIEPLQESDGGELDEVLVSRSEEHTSELQSP